MMDYSVLTYPQLKAECARRGLGGAGKGDELLAKLNANDLGEEYQQPEEQPVPDPVVPTFADWDKNGKWVRRPRHFISWADEEQKWRSAHGSDQHTPAI